MATATFTLTIDLDPTPGRFHTADSAWTVIQNVLNDVMGHYNPRLEKVVVDHRRPSQSVFREVDPELEALLDEEEEIARRRHHNVFENEEIKPDRPNPPADWAARLWPQ